MICHMSLEVTVVDSSEKHPQLEIDESYELLIPAAGKGSKDCGMDTAL